MEKAKTLILIIKTLTKCLGDRVLFVITDLLGISITELVESFQTMDMDEGMRNTHQKANDLIRYFRQWIDLHISLQEVKQEIKHVTRQLLEDCFAIIKIGRSRKPSRIPESELEAITGKGTKLILNEAAKIYALEFDAYKILSDLRMRPITDPGFQEFVSRYRLEEQRYIIDSGSLTLPVNESMYEMLRLFEEPVSMYEVMERIKGNHNSEGNNDRFMKFVLNAIETGILQYEAG